jgi:hypothetical protein
MSEAGPPAAPSSPARRPLGCVTKLLLAIVVLIVVVIGIGYAFDQGDSAEQPQHGFGAGPASAYQSPSVTAFEAEHLFLVRLPDGSFTAIYDRSPKQQEMQGSCRVVYDQTAGIGTLDTLPGLQGGFVEACDGNRAVWRADGAFAFGTGYGDLDRYAVHVDGGGDVIIETDSRTCTRSKGVIGQAPYEKRTCGAGD